MTQDEVVEMARQAGIKRDTAEYHKDELEAFAKLVAAKAIAGLESQEPVAWMQVTKYGNKLLAFTEPPLEPPCYTGEFIAAKNYPLFLKKENT
jgi:hypothetical protein